MKTFAKIKSIAAVLVIFLVVLSTNLIDKDNFQKVEASVEKIYEEQLLAKSAIIDLTNLVHEKKVALLIGDTNYYKLRANLCNIEITSRIEDCERGEVNKKEGYILKELKDNCDQVFVLERSDSSIYGIQNTEHYKRIELIEEEIGKLADIHLEKGRQQKLISREAMASAKLFSRIEIYLLIALAVGVQLIILFPKSKTILSDES